MTDSLHFPEWVDRMKVLGWKQDGGSIVIQPTIPAINTLEPRQFDLFASFESKEPQPVEWQVQAQYNEASTGVGFPPIGTAFNLFAGALDVAGGPILHGAQGAVVCKLELGGGPNARVIYTDLRNGRFSLGVQQFVKVSVARWAINDPIGATILAQCSLVPSKGHTDAEPPVFSCLGNVAVAGTVSVVIPPGATWFYLTNIDLGTQLTVNAVNARWLVDSAAAAPVFYPPNPPWPVPAGATVLDIENTGGATANFNLQFWVR